MSISSTRPARHVHGEALFNFRDLGGYTGRAGQTLRWHQLYRADAIPRATAGDREMLTDLGLRTIIDLRTAGECTPTETPLEGLAAYHHIPLLERSWADLQLEPGDDAVAFLTERYIEMLTDRWTMVARAFHVIAGADNRPLVFHCSVGKDRTGVLAAVVLATLGVHEETIAEDFALSASAMDRLADWLLVHRPDAYRALCRQPQAYLAAPATAILGLLAFVRENFGSMVGYVRAIGVDLEVVEALHANLLV